jgi:Mor family transcriptional regulator
MKPIYRFERVNGRLEATGLLIPLGPKRNHLAERDAEIRAKYRLLTQPALAKEYGLTQQQISRIVRGIRSGRRTRRRRGVPTG